MKISKQARREAKELFRSCVANGALDEDQVRRAVRQILDAKPRGYLAILSHFQRLLKLHLDGRTAVVETAVALDDQQKASVTASLNQRYGAGLILSFQPKPSLIGGLRVRVGSDVFDGSVQARLSALEASF